MLGHGWIVQTPQVGCLHNQAWVAGRAKYLLSHLKQQHACRLQSMHAVYIAILAKGLLCRRLDPAAQPPLS